MPPMQRASNVSNNGNDGGGDDGKKFLYKIGHSVYFWLNQQKQCLIGVVGVFGV